MSIRHLLLVGLLAVAMPTAASAQSDISGRLLALHNAERARMRAAPLRWDPRLAAAAASYGATLARMGRLQHAPPSLRAGQGENLWMGTRGAFSPEQMVGSWLDERRLFRPGIFPNVSRNRNWADVGHYTQIIWKGTTHVGCAIRQSARWDFLICRYAPAGNIMGSPIP